MKIFKIYKKKNFRIWARLQKEKLTEIFSGRIYLAGAVISSAAFLFIFFFVNISAEEKPFEISGFSEKPLLDASELTIIQAAPEGEITSSDLKKEIVVVFSHPMVPLSVINKNTGGLYSIHPRISGKFRWYGSRVLAFAPSEKFSEGTEYRVDIPQGLKSLNGFQLKQAKSFIFKTAPIKVLNVASGSGSGRIGYDNKFTLTFNYPVALNEIRKKVSLLSETKKYSFRVFYPALEENDQSYGDDLLRKQQKVTVVPRGSFDRDSVVRLVIAEGLRASGGNQGLSEKKIYTYRTYGALSAKIEGKARYFENIYSFRLVFSNPVNIKNAIKHITFNPPAKLEQEYNYENTESLYLSSWNLKPSTAYTIKIEEGMTDAYGNAYTGQREFYLKTPRVRRSFSAQTGTGFIESMMAQKIPVFARGMSGLNATIAHLDLKDIPALLADGFSFYKEQSFTGSKSIFWSLNQQENASDLMGFDLSPHLNNGNGWLYVSFSGDIEKWNGKSSSQRFGQVVQSTDLGLLVKESYDYADVWVHSLSSGRPVADSEIVSYENGRDSGKCRTDLTGYCRLSKSENSFRYDNKIYYTAKKGSDRTFVLNRDHRLYMGTMSPHFSAIASLPSLAGQIVFDRKLYRPGDSVRIKVFASVRERGKLMTGAKSTGDLRIIVSNSRGEEIFNDTKAVSDQGGASLDIAIPADAPTGHYTVAVSSTRLEKFREERDFYPDNSVFDTFQIEEFRPVNFSVNANGMKDGAVGENLRVEIEGRYLFGSPMGDARYRYTVNRKPLNLTVPNYSEYLFGDDDYGDTWEPVTWSYFSGGNGLLNAAGKADIKIPLEAFSPQGFENDKLSRMYMIELESSVTDVDDKTVTNRSAVSVYAGKYFPGIRVRDRYQNKNKPFEFDFVLMSTETKTPLSGNVQVIIHKKVWKSVHMKGPSDSVQRKNTLIRQEVLRKNLFVSAEGSKFTFQAPEAGNYSITIRDAGGMSYSRMNFYSYGSEYIGWDFPDDDSLVLLPDRAEYSPGDTAKILIQSPYQKSTAIVTMEREGVLSQKSYELIGNGNPLEIPIKDEYAPNIYVGVVLLRPRVGEKDASLSEEEDMGRPRMKAGVVRLNVSASSRRIPFSVSADRKTYEPGGEVRLVIKSVPFAEIALSVADRAVLDLVSYKYGDPLERFYNSWPHGVQIIDNRHALIQQVSYANKGNSPGGKGWGAETEKGGGFGDDSEDGVRKDFRYTAYWNPSVRADKNGNARITFRLPHNLTSFRVQALASATGKYGLHVSEFQVKKPVLLQTVMPRFIRPGDELEIGAVVINQTDRETSFRIKFSSELLSIAGGDNGSEKVVQMKPAESKEVTFHVTLNEKQYLKIRDMLRIRDAEKTDLKDGIRAAGFFSVKPANPEIYDGSGFSISSLSDKVLFNLPVFEQPVSEAFAVSGFTQNQTEEMLQIPDANLISPFSGGLELLVSSTALTGLDAGFKFYESNPYFCLEQKASAFLLTMTSGELLKSFNFKPPEKNSYDFQRIENLFIGSLKDHQNADGGFRLWKESSSLKSNPYLTAYIVFVLQNAKEANDAYEKKYVFPDKIYEGAVRYLKNYIRRPEKDSMRYNLETLAFVQHLLSREGDADIFLEKLLVNNLKNLSLRGQSHLALSMAIRKNISYYKSDETLTAIVTNIKNRMVFDTRKIHFNEPGYESYMRTYYSDGSTLAAVLQVFMSLDGKNELIPMMVQGAISQNNAVLWQDSHGTGNLAYSLWLYHNKYEKVMNFSGTALFGQKSILEHTFKSDLIEQVSGNINMSDILSAGEAKKNIPLSVKVEGGNGRLYYTGLLQYSYRKPSAEPRDEGIEVHREIFRADGTDFAEKKEAKSFVRGGMYLVRLRVVNPKPVYYFILNDPLASNMEIVNTGFQTESSSLNRFLEKKRSENDREGFWWENSDTIYEYRDDRVLIKNDYLSPGIHEYYYIARGSVRGTSLQPSARAWGMYEPEIFGRTSSRNHSVQ